MLGIFTSKYLAIGLAATVLFAGVQTWRISSLKDDIVALKQDITAEKDAHKATKKHYAQAQTDAAELEQRRLERVKTQQEAITHDIETDYRGRLAAARARADQLRRDYAAAKRASNYKPVSGVPDPASGVNGPTTDYGFSIDKRLTATEQALQLQALQDWANRQLNVQVNEGP